MPPDELEDPFAASLAKVEGPRIVRSGVDAASIPRATVKPVVDVTAEAPTMTIVSAPPKRGPGRPPKTASPASPAAPAARPKPTLPAPPADNTSPLSLEEQATFTFAIMELFDMADTGLWYVGMDTDPDTIDEAGLPGVPIWHLEDEKEARAITRAFVAVGKRRPAINASMRALNNAHEYLQAGLILGSRFWETGTRLFREGINFRTSKPAWEKSVNEHLSSQPAPRGFSLNGH